MGKQESKQLENRISVVVVLFLVCLCMYGIQWIYGITIFPDEFGYWACAANALGFDWSEVTSISSYYSFGYSLILIPIIKMFSDSVLAYRAAIIVNLILQVTSFFLIKKIIRMLFDQVDDALVAILAGVCVLYPSWCLYVQITMAEAVLFFMYTLTVYFMLKYLEKPSLSNGIATALSAIYLYTVHMRSIGVLCAVGVSVLVRTFIVINSKTEIVKERKRMVFSFIFIVALIILLFVLSLFVKNYYIDALYSSGAENLVSTNDYSGQVDKIKALFTLKGIATFLTSMVGKIFYLGCATFGLAYCGIHYLIKKSIMKNEKALFILLASFFQFMVMCIYTITTSSKTSNRFDLFIHGRYYDFVIPLLMAVGIYGLINSEHTFKKMLFSGLIFLISTAITIYVVAVNDTHMNNPHGALSIGISYFYDKYNFRPFYTIIMGAAFAVLIGVISTVAINLYKTGKSHFFILLICIVLLGQSYHALNHFIYQYQVYIFGDTQVADTISELRNSGYSGDVVLLYEGGTTYVNNVQLRIRNERIKVKYLEGLDTDDENVATDIIQALPDDALVLVDFESNLNDYLAEKYDGNWLSGHFDLYYKK